MDSGFEVNPFCLLSIPRVCHEGTDKEAVLIRQFCRERSLKDRQFYWWALAESDTKWTPR